MRRSVLVRLLAVAITVAAIAAGPAVFKLAAPAAAGPERVDTAIGNWHFHYTIPGADATGDYSIGVDYPRAAAAEVRAAATAMNQYAEQTARADQPFQATIVFARPLSTEEFAQFVAATGIAPTGSIVRAFQPDGTRVTMGVPPVWATDGQGHRLIGQAAPGQSAFDAAAFERLRGGHPENRVAGVVSTDVTLDAGTYGRIKGRPEVFALDTLQDIVSKDVQRQHPGTRAAKVHVQSSRLYWALEDVGLVAR